jgi:hypothetical protein
MDRIDRISRNAEYPISNTEYPTDEGKAKQGLTTGVVDGQDKQ